VMELARQAAGEPALAALLQSEADGAALWERVRSDPAFAAFHQEVRAYLDRFGDRCANELKLETVTLGEEPGFLLQMVRAYVRQGLCDPDAARAKERALRSAAEAQVCGSLRGLRRAAYLWVLQWA